VIRIVIADDEELIRGALVALLGLEPDLEVVADVADGAAAVTGARTHRPDVVLLDLEMPVLDGIEAARALSDAMPTVIVTRHARPGTLRRALSAGVRGFVPKSTPAARLAEIIRDVAAGERYIDAGLAAAALTEDESPLTPREADGTVRNHLSSAIAKLHVDNRVAAAAVAWDRGWI
jgi:two-component system response regulator DesR